MGSFDAFLLVTHDSYPQYYSYFEPYRSETRFWEGNWTGYYDGYYARDDIWYTETFTVPDQFILVPTDEMHLYQDISYQQIIQTSTERSITLSRLPVEDLFEVDVPPLSQDISMRFRQIRRRKRGPDAALFDRNV